MALPKFQSDDQSLMLLQTTWSAQLDPALQNPLMQGKLLKSVSLTSGDNIVNHLLGRKLQGWFIVRQRAAGTVYDKQDSNQIPNLTLLLNASTALVVDLFVF